MSFDPALALLSQTGAGPLRRLLQSFWKYTSPGLLSPLPERLFLLGADTLDSRFTYHRLLFVPLSRLLIRVGDAQDRLFAKRLAQQLEADRQFRRLGEAARNADAANAREVGGDGED